MERLPATKMAGLCCGSAVKPDVLVRNLVDGGLIAEGDRFVYNGEVAEVTCIGTLKWRNGEYASVSSWSTAVAAGSGRKPSLNAVLRATLVNGKSLAYWTLLFLLALLSSYDIDKHTYPLYYPYKDVPKDLWHEVVADLDKMMENGMFRCRVPTCRALKPTLELRHLHEVSHPAADRLQLRSILPTAEAAPRHKRARDDDAHEAESAAPDQRRRAGLTGTPPAAGPAGTPPAAGPTGTPPAAGPTGTPPAADSYMQPAHTAKQKEVPAAILSCPSTPTHRKKAPATGASSAKSGAGPAARPRWTTDVVRCYMLGRNMSDAGLRFIKDNQISGVDLLSYVEGRALGDRFDDADKKVIEQSVAAHRDTLKNEPCWTADMVWAFLSGRGLSDAGLSVLWDHQITSADLLSYVEGRVLGDRFGEADKKLIEVFVATNWDALKDECRRD